MTAFQYFTLTILFLIVIAIGWLIKQQFKEKSSATLPINPTIPDYKPGWKVYTGLILTVIFVIISFVAPVILTQQSFNSNYDFSATGQIGDTIGGLTSPFLGIAAIIMTGMAFYVQYKANQQQRDQFIAEQAENKKLLQDQINHQNTQTQLVQFESQFYEMLKLHRDNIEEMQITGYDFIEEGTELKRFEKVTEGRKVFVTMKTELEAILGIYRGVHGILNEEGFEKCYQIFFGGLEEFEKKHPEEKEFIRILKLARVRHEHPEPMKVLNNKMRKEFSPVAHLFFNYKPFSGHASRLGHYFRHLYFAVKSVVNSKVITDYEEKMKYLAMLRAQLSNHEQILLFYNWLSGYGGNWENNKHTFLTNYKMVHNLWYDTLFDDVFIRTKVDYLRKKPAQNRKGKMYEID